ncbi:hypothetical protein SUGI_0013800 [Cryptomeria japonica]|uniref:nardilysin-like n=1 Tax=Cryptomeria japonica TaxID=3369 RepID=UPI002408E578|nr:nardilysin-like [Cryptomeria japonica]GLJ05210.1 hypothetical protein SUGI_0013800 [Cryptomeria japonica]
MAFGKGEIIKSPEDKAQYKIVHLPNGLTAVLVHDPQVLSEKEEKSDPSSWLGTSPIRNAAAAMCVGVGSFSDPVDAQGLAHFLEHMLYMGSSGFPGENEFDTYVAMHGGSSNAYTANDCTFHYFEVNGKFLKPSLKRFSQLLTSPLVKAEAVQREIEALDSEFAQALKCDNDRLVQVQCHTAAAGHPLNRFIWGNKETLMAKGVDNIRRELLDFFNEYYVAGHMKLAVIGGESLDMLEEWVMQLFGNVRKDVSQKLTFHNSEALSIWKPGKMYWIAAMKDVHDLILTWPLPFLCTEYLKKPMEYISHLICQQGSGSCLSLLQSKGWATSIAMSTSLQDEIGDGRGFVGYMFQIKIELTISGLQKVLEVIRILYQYIKFLVHVGPQEWIFKELEDIGDLCFTFAEKQSQHEYASHLAKNLLKYPEEHILYGEHAFKIWDPKLISHVLSFLNPNNMRVDIVTKSLNLGSPAIRYEPWFGVPYFIQSIPSSILKGWKCSHFIEAGLHLPHKNNYIPRNFSMRSMDDYGTGNFEIPICINDDQLIKIWYKEDHHVPQATAYFWITFLNRPHYSKIKAIVLTEMYVLLLLDALREMLYQARVAKLNIKIFNVGQCRFELKIWGFSENLPVLTSNILRFLKTFIPAEKQFKMIKEQMKRNYKNMNMNPMTHWEYLISSEFDKKLSCLNSLSLSEIKKHISALFEEVHIEGLCHGKLSKADVTNIADIFKLTFASAIPLQAEICWTKNSLPHGARLIKDTYIKNKTDINSSVEIYFQMGSVSMRTKAMADLFEYIVSEPFYNELRTDEQLGYSVDCGTKVSRDVVGFSFTVKSSKHNPPYLQDRIDAFIARWIQTLEHMSEKEFQYYKSTLLANKLEKRSLEQETYWYWNEILKGTYLFEGYKLEVDELRKLAKLDIVGWCTSHLNPKSADCTRVSIRAWGCNSRQKQNTISTL